MDADDPTRTAAAAVGAPRWRALAEGRFELLQELGRGSSGNVFRARLVQPYGDLAAGAEAAIKFLRTELADDERAHARLFAEGELGQSLRHPNLAAIHGVETITRDGLTTTFLVMQYVPGTTLRDFVLRSGQPVEDLTRRIGADAAKGLAALHRRGLVHRDVKPENLILTPDSELKIVDLGLARPFGAQGGGSSGGSGGSAGRSSGFGLAGSLAYAAPESLRGDPTGPRADLYALGLVLFEVTTGRHAFADATTPDAMLDAQLHREPPRPSHLRPRVSPLLEQLLLDLLRKQPDQRPRDALDVARILEQGERSEYWRRHELKLPTLASQRRLLRMRRPAETPFFGRRQELDLLDAALAGARAGRGGVVVVTGPEGMGRRRLLDEAMQRWLGESAAPLLLGGAADSGLGHGEPFASQLLDVLLRGDDHHSPNARQRAADAAKAQFGGSDKEAEALADVALGASTEPSEVRAERLATALLKLPRKGQPLVVRVDLADELDTSGRLVLQRLAARAGRLPLLLLLATGVDGLRLELPEARRIDLAGLDEADFAAFGRALFAAECDAEDFLRRAHQVLSGLPGNLLEALDQMAQDGELAGRPGGYRDLARDAEIRPAPGLLERFRRRVAKLLPAQRAVLEAAAVLGERSGLADLAALVPASEFAVLETLSLFRGRIVRAQGGEVSFRHRDFQKQLLRELPEERRVALHRRAAALLAERNENPLVVGMHLSQGMAHEECLDPLLDGLDARVRAGSRRTALRVIGRLAVHLAAVAGTPANTARRLRYLLLSGQARANAGQFDAAIKAFQQAEALAQQLGDVDRSAAARTGIANADLDSGRLVAAIARLETVHQDLAERRNPLADALAAQAHGLHGRILLYRGAAGDGLRHLQLALRRVPAADEDLRCHLAIDLARVEALDHLYGKALKTLQDVERSPAVRNLPRVQLRFHLYRGQLRALVGDEEAREDLRLALDEAERLALPTYGARAAVFLGERAFWQRKDERAVEAFHRAVALARAGGDRLGEAMARGYLVRLGADDPHLAALVDDLALPSLRANLLLAKAGRDDADDAMRDELAAMLAGADLPLSLHLRVLALLDRPASARALVRQIAERFAHRAMRQRFLALWHDGARV
ncbi:MAG: protein kinase domain-containing protein [Planctomycetota bacterium]